MGPFTGTKLEGNGFFSKLTTESLKKMNYNFKIKIVSWARAVEMTKSGKADVLLGASYTKERTKFFEFPEYYWENSIYFFTKVPGRKNYNQLSNLCPSRVAILLGSFLIEKIKKVKCLKIDIATSIELNIRKLLNNRVNYLIETEASLLYEMKRKFSKESNKIQKVLPSLLNDKVYIVVSKKYPYYKKLSKDIDKGIKQLKETGEYQKIINKFLYLENKE